MKNSLPIVKSVCIKSVLILSVLIALGPFLHAHLGASNVTGLHIAGLNSVRIATEPAFISTFFSQDDEQESAALGVETSYSRQIPLDVQDQPQSLLILSIYVLAALMQGVVFFLRIPDTQRAGRLSFLAGLPPLPHAPPTSHF